MSTKPHHKFTFIKKYYFFINRIDSSPEACFSEHFWESEKKVALKFKNSSIKLLKFHPHEHKQNKTVSPVGFLQSMVYCFRHIHDPMVGMHGD